MIITDRREILSKPWAELEMPEKLTLAADNIERARTTGCIEHLAGWEHLVIRETVTRIERLRSVIEKFERS